MHDPAFDPLLAQLHGAHNCLWLADEAHAEVLPQLAAYGARVTVLSNRFNIVEKARTLGLKTHFSDWQLDPAGGFDLVALRICKEKPVNFHLINSAFEWLCPGGRLCLSGAKTEGIKSVAASASTLFDSERQLQKAGPVYWQGLTKRPTPPSAWLDSQDYRTIRPIGTWLEKELYSKPGVYGWDKIDRGSELLVEHSSLWLYDQGSACTSLLDIGCGYGLLAVSYPEIPFMRRVATDNNAAALACTRYNAQARNLALEVIAGDCADTVHGHFDVIVCNPPFHTGFEVDGTLTERFLKAAQQRLDRRGAAFFVVNRFIPLEKKAAAHFASVKCLADMDGFKIVLLRHC